MTLHHEVEGPAGAPVLVLLGTIGSTLHSWDAVTGSLAEDLRVVQVDTRGHGGSAPVRSDRPPSIADLGADVLDLLDHLAAPRVHLAGVSLGGMTAMWLAVHHPDRIGRLALLGTSAYLPPAQVWRDRAALVLADGMAAVAAAAAARWITTCLAKRDPELMAWLTSMLLGADPEDYAWCCGAIAAMDLRADLPRIAAATLVVVGAEDPATPVPHAETIAAGIHGARLEVVPDAAHVAPVEQPGVVAALLGEHFGADRLAAGMRTRREVLGDAHVDRALAAATELTAPFQDFITRYAWGEVWTEDTLSRRERSVATLAALVALGAEGELALHVRAALRNGMSEQEIGAVLRHTAVYAGVPRVNSALALAQRVLDEERTGG